MKNKSKFENLSLEELEQRGWIVDEIKTQIEGVMWDQIRARYTRILSADDGTPYTQSQLESMVGHAVNAASAHLRLYL
jgi:hypothetical protein